ncbi:uncharacterized protein A4U43_C09F15360 [Asparagus officinalis]|uniref:3-methyl-2-oxobutanoate hydroxymethyltransferase n=1 Tax=Asparagus officinalis TaxID=4686 RepID=A0A5P1E7V7_ASPOF|nr:uncharacterized protein A4U43_C09F15360 [Asparagus officinalis]
MHEHGSDSGERDSIARSRVLRGCVGVRAVAGSATTLALRVPTIGAGAGPFCSGQALIYHDLVGMMQQAHHAKVAPRFSKRYGNSGEVIHRALSEFKNEVESKSFPGPKHTPYKISEADHVEGFMNELQMMGLSEAASAAASVAEMEAAAKTQAGAKERIG